MLDAAEFWRLFRADRGHLYTTLSAAYPLMPPHYVMYFVDCAAEQDGNPRICTYVESDLGAVQRSHDLLDGLAGGLDVRGTRCLDIGCSNGALLRAALQRGAQSAVGVDVSAARLISARKVCLGHPVEFLELDASADPLPGRPFDVIFCTDVLEHVSDWPHLLAHAATALAPTGTLFLALHNARHPETVLAEPHYGIPGLVLLAPAEAAALWGRVRATVGSALDYDVATWPLYPEVRDQLAALGLTAAPWIDCAPAYTPAFWAAPADGLTLIVEQAAVALARLSLPAPEAADLLTAVERYAREAREDFARATAGAIEDRLTFFLTYHAQPLNLLVRHA